MAKESRWQAAVRETHDPSFPNKTVWQRAVQEGGAVFAPPSSVARSSQLTGTPADVEDDSIEGISNRLYRQMNGSRVADTPEARVQNSAAGEPIVSLPVNRYDEFWDDEQRETFDKVIGQEQSYRERATAEAMEKYGQDFVKYDPETRRQIVEYETDALLEAQFGKPMRDYSTLSTAGQGFQEGFESSFAANVGTLTSAYTGLGGRLLAENPETGQRELFQSYEDLIPGFNEMEIHERRQAISDWKEKELNRNAVERNAKQEGIVHGVAMFGGWLADPTTAIPVGKSYKIASLSSGAIAGSDVFLYDLARKGEINPERIITGTAIGAVGGPAMIWGGRKIRGLAKSRHYNKILNKYETEYTRALSKGDSKDFAELYARVSAGNMSQEGLDSLYTFTGRTKVVPDTPHAAKLAMEERLSFIHRFETLNKVGRGIEDVITPISDRISRISPKVAHGLRKMEMRTHVQQHLWFDEVKPWISQSRKMSKADRLAVKKAVMSQDPAGWGEAYKIMRGYEKEGGKFKGMVDNFDKVRTVLKEVGMRYKQNGFDLDLREHYFPRVANDPSAIKKLPYSFVQDALDKARKAKGEKLTDREIQRVFEDLITFKPKPGGKVKTSGSLRERSVNDQYLETLLPHYADPEGALHSYLRMASIDINRSQFMKNLGYKGKFRVEGTDIGDQLGTVIDKEVKRIGLGMEKRDELIELLQSRMTTGEQAPNSFWRGFKNLGYTTTLGNPVAAMTQTGDQAFALFKAGIRDATKAALSPKIMKKLDLGLEEAMEEIYSHPSALKRTLDFSLRWGGFNGMDKLGKETILNGALRKYMRMLKTEKGQRKFVAKWGRYFGNETSSLMSDIKKFGQPYTTKVTKGKNAGKTIERVGEMSDNMRLMLWHELSDVQPISLAEMPKFYLDHPNLRVLYMLKTFTIKQVDFMRREIFRKFNEGKYGEASKNLAAFTTFWMMMNGTADGLKSVLTGDEFDINDNMVENLMQLTVWSRYSNEQALKEGYGQAVINFVAPPVPFIDKPTLAVTRGDPLLALEPVPIVGKVISKRMQNAQKARAKVMKGQPHFSFDEDREFLQGKPEE